MYTYQIRPKLGRPHNHWVVDGYTKIRVDSVLNIHPSTEGSRTGNEGDTTLLVEDEWGTLVPRIT